MKILYVTDLHGDVKKFEKVIEISERENIKTVINGGDLLPKRGNREKIQIDFINNYLPDYFNRLNKIGINYYVMLGNDDLEKYDELFDQLCNEYSNIYNIAEKKYKFGEYEIIGMNKILDTPFFSKDRIINEENFKSDVEILPEGLKYINGNYYILANWPEFLETLPKMKDVLNSLPKPDNLKRTIYVMHEPPAYSNLGRIDSTKNFDVGSIDIFNFIKEKQPLITFHGHIHESPIVGGDYYKRIGKTLSIQPGQTEFGEEDFIYVIVDLDNLKISRKAIKVR